MYVGSRKLARPGRGRIGAIYDWRRTCDRASWKFMSARTAPSDKTYYRRRIARADAVLVFVVRRFYRHIRVLPALFFFP